MLFKVILKTILLKFLLLNDQRVLFDLKELRNKLNKNCSTKQRLTTEIKQSMCPKMTNQQNQRRLINQTLKKLNINKSNRQLFKFEIFKMQETNISTIQMRKSLQLLLKISLMIMRKLILSPYMREIQYKRKCSDESLENKK